jgi:lysophospholipase L1-like esterase/predicted peptidase
MANNIFAGRGNLIIARQGTDGALISTIFNSSNILIIYDMTTSIKKSYVPGRTINQFSNFVKDGQYYVIPLVDMDVSAFFAPPIGVPIPTTTAIPTTTSIPTTVSPTTVTPTTADPNAPIRYATANDLLNISNASAGDLIVAAGNDSGGRNILFRPAAFSAYTQNFLLDCTSGSKKILLKGGDYDLVEIDFPGLTGTPTNPIIITNYGGQVRTKELRLKGLQYVKFTGKYDPIAKTGDPNFRGHQKLGGVDYADTAGTYGFLIDKQWLDISQNCISVNGSVKLDGTAIQASDMEMEYFEYGNGGFSFQVKDEVNETLMNNMVIHDFYGHDTHGELFYGGPTNGLPSRHQIKLHMYNFRMLRSGNDGLQAGQLAAGSIIENGVVHGANNWRSCFDENQDAVLQLGICDGNVIIRNIYGFGGGQQFINWQTDNQNHSTGNTGFIDVSNCSFQFCAGPRGAYIGQATPVPAPIRFRNNLFSFFNYKYNQAYRTTNPNFVPKATHVFRVATSSVYTFSGNKIDDSDGHVNLLENPATGANLETGTTHGSIERPPFLNYIPAVQSNYDWNSFGQWANKYFQTWGDEYDNSVDQFQGTAVSYSTGDFVMHKSRFYQCLANHSSIEPGAGINWQNFWQLITFTNGSITPPDDVRMAFGSTHNSLGIGLLDNPTSSPTTAGPTTTAAPTTSATTTAAFQQNPDLNAFAYDNGDNTLTLKYERNRASLIVGTTVIALGSSTLAGNGSSSYATSLAGLIEGYISTITGGQYVFVSNGVAGTDTRSALPNGQDPTVNENKNISAAVAGRPSCILVFFPTNDITIGTAQEFTNRIITIFNYARSFGIPIFIESPQPRTSFTSTMQQSLVDAYNLLKAAIPARFFIDVFQQLRDPASGTPASILAQYAFSDGTHVNDSGHNLIFQATKTLMETYFQDQGGQGYEVERSLSPTSGFVTLTTIPSSSQPSIILTRQDLQTYYYRVRAKLTSTPTYSGYSNVTSLTQPIAVSGVSQTIKLAFQPQLDGSNNPTTVPAGWNNITAVSVPSAGNTYANLIDSGSTVTSTVVTVTKAFSSVSFGGSPSATGFSGVGSGNWNVAGNITTRGQLQISGLAVGNVYNIKILCSRGTNNINWYTTIQSGNSFGGSRVSNVDTTPQFTNIIHLQGLIPDVNGVLTIDVYAQGGGYINAMIIEKNSNAATTTPAPTTTAAPTTTVAPTTGAPTTTLTRTAQVNIHGGTPASLAGWFDWNIGAVEAYNISVSAITDSSGAATPWGAILSGTFGLNDNGSTYGNGQSSLMCPQAILRFVSRATQTPTVLTINGLDNTKAYNIEVYISRNTGTDASQVVAIGSNTVSLQAANNFTNAALFNNVSPVGGQIVINDSRGVTNPNFTYYNGFKIIELGANGTTTAAPTTAGTTAAGTTTAAPTTQAGTTGGPTTQIITSTVNQTIKSFTVTANGSNPVSWNYCEKLPSDWVSNPSGTYPLIIFFVGLGEANTNTNNIFAWGPSKFIKNGWDGKITVGATTWDPIIVTIQPTSQWPNTNYASDAVNKIITTYGARVLVDKVYLTGLSMGGWMMSGIIMNNQTTCDKIAGWVNIEGVVPDDWGSNAQTPPFTNMQNCHRGRWLAYQQRDDYRYLDTLAATINGATLNAGKSPTEAVWYQTTFITSGTTAGHGAFDQFYDPTLHAYPAPDGVTNDTIYMWMMRQTRTAT